MRLFVFNGALLVCTIWSNLIMLMKHPPFFNFWLTNQPDSSFSKLSIAAIMINCQFNIAAAHISDLSGREVISVFMTSRSIYHLHCRITVWTRAKVQKDKINMTSSIWYKIFHLIKWLVQSWSHQIVVIRRPQYSLNDYKQTHLLNYSFTASIGFVSFFCVLE